MSLRRNVRGGIGTIAAVLLLLILGLLIVASFLHSIPFVGRFLP